MLVSNVWLDPVFVAGAIGLPLALSSNMVNAIFIVSGLVTLIQATKLVRLPIIFDGRNILHADNVLHAGFEYHSVGRRSLYPTQR